MKSVTEEFFSILAANTVDANTPPIRQQQIPNIKPRQIAAKIVKNGYVKLTPTELEYEYVINTGLQMRSFEVLENVGRVYNCRYMPRVQRDPFLPYVDIIGYQKYFRKMLGIITICPELERPDTLIKFTGVFTEAELFLRNKLNPNEFEFYMNTMKKLITQPQQFLKHTPVDVLGDKLMDWPTLFFIFIAVFIIAFLATGLI